VKPAVHAAGAWARRPARQLLERPETSGVLINASRDPDAKLTFVITGPQCGPTPRVVKIPATATAGEAVDREGRMLVEVRRLGLGRLAPTVPRYVESLTIEGRPVLIATAVPGTPMTIGYHRWPHTARPSAVRGDFHAALTWLAGFQRSTARGEARDDWAAQVLEAVRGRWDGHPALADAVVRLEAAADSLSRSRCPDTAVHGDFWFGNLLVQGGSVSGVVDWENAAPLGCPLRDLARFVLSYALYLDRHTRAGHRVLGHPALRRGQFGAGIRYALCDAGWFPDLVRGTLGRELGRLGISPSAWYDVALTGIGEVAAAANDDEFGAGHLQLLASLPVRARRHRGHGR
jgi:phosphotransferase family enzyme